MLSELILFPFIPYIITSGNFGIEHEIVTERDLDHLIQLLDGKIGDAAWQHQMERTTSNMLYQAWRYEPEVHYISLVTVWFLYTIIFFGANWLFVLMFYIVSIHLTFTHLLHY